MFNHKHGFIDMPVTIACGQCIGCRLERSRQWAMRCVHESSLHEDNSFITLTYADDHVPIGGSLVKKHFQDFIKRLRWHLNKKHNTKIRYYACGEYGSQYERPHYHSCIFGWDFPDKYLWSTRRGVKLYRSPTLETLWPVGFSTVGDVTFESAAYTARYIVKKITGELAAETYERIDTTTGEIHSITPEYTTMSLRPAIGKDWFETFTDDVYPSDFVIMRGKKLKPPRYYNGLYELSHPTEMLSIKKARIRSAMDRRADNTPDRLATRERCKKLQTQQLKRTYEEL